MCVCVCVCVRERERERERDRQTDRQTDRHRERDREKEREREKRENVVFLVPSASKVLFLFNTFSYWSISPFLQSVLVLYYYRWGREPLKPFIGPGCSAAFPSGFSPFPGSSLLSPLTAPHSHPQALKGPPCHVQRLKNTLC